MSLLAQGSYGCVYYPGYSCKKKKMNKKYVSKLSRDDKESQVEYNTSKIVKKIPNYSKHFIVIERKCKVKQPKINKIKVSHVTVQPEVSNVSSKVEEDSKVQKTSKRFIYKP